MTTSGPFLYAAPSHTRNMVRRYRKSALPGQDAGFPPENNAHQKVGRHLPEVSTQKWHEVS
jgi:hypothetical protein